MTFPNRRKEGTLSSSHPVTVVNGLFLRSSDGLIFQQSMGFGKPGLRESGCKFATQIWNLIHANLDLQIPRLFISIKREGASSGFGDYLSMQDNT